MTSYYKFFCFLCFSMYPGPFFWCTGTAEKSFCGIPGDSDETEGTEQTDETEETEETEGTEDNDADGADSNEWCDWEVYFEEVFINHFYELFSIADFVKRKKVHAILNILKVWHYALRVVRMFQIVTLWSTMHS